MIEPQLPDCLRCKGTGVFRQKGDIVPVVCACAAGRHISMGQWTVRRAKVLERALTQ